MVVAFAYGWDLTLVILSMLPLMSVFGALAAKVQTSFAQKEMEAYGQAGAIAEEVLSAVRTVVAFGGEKKEVARYEEKLEGARSKGVQRGMLTGLGGGLSFGTMFAMYGLGFWYGIKLGGVINHDLKRYKWISLSLYKRKREKKRFFKNFVVLTLHRRSENYHHWEYLKGPRVGKYDL